MITLNELRKDKDLLNNIDWNMTPEKAVDMYLEWGAGWTRGNDFVTGKDESIYFVLFDGEATPQVTLIKRTMKEAVELAKIPVPRDLFQDACKEAGSKPEGTVQPLNDTLKQWISTVLKSAPGMLQ